MGESLRYPVSVGTKIDADRPTHFLILSIKVTHIKNSIVGEFVVAWLGKGSWRRYISLEQSLGFHLMCHNRGLKLSPRPLQASEVREVEQNSVQNPLNRAQATCDISRTRANSAFLLRAVST